MNLLGNQLDNRNKFNKMLEQIKQRWSQSKRNQPMSQMRISARDLPQNPFLIKLVYHLKILLFKAQLDQLIGK